MIFIKACATILALAIAAIGCSGTSDEAATTAPPTPTTELSSEPRPSPTELAPEASEPAATVEITSPHATLVAETPTATPTPTEPTPAEPTPEPIFHQVALPNEVVSEPARSFFGVAPGTGSLPTVGVGHEFLSATGWSTPIAWTFSTDNKLSFEHMPLPDGVPAGNTFDAASGGDAQFAVGHVHENGAKRAAIWRRNQASLWSVNASITDSVFDSPATDSSIIDIAASESMQLTVLRAKRSDAIDDEYGYHTLISTNGQDWAQLELPGTNPQQWRFGVYASGTNGLIAARNPDETAPTTLIFTTTDGGKSWQSGEVGTPSNKPASLLDALWDGEQWFGVGRIGTGDEQEPGTFIFDDDGWQARAASIDFGSLEPVERGSFVGVTAIANGQIAAILDTQPGSQTFVSNHGNTWWHDEDLWLNRFDPDSDADFRAMAFDPERQRVLVARGFDRPVWLTREGTQVTDGSLFERQTRRVTGMAGLADGFLIIGHDTRVVFPGTNYLTTTDIENWSPTPTDPEIVATDMRDLDDVLLLTGTDARAEPFLRLVGSTKRNVDSDDLFPFTSTFQHSPLRTAAASGRNLIATAVEVQDEEFVHVAFVDLSDPAAIRHERIPDSRDLAPTAVCPELSSGDTAVILNQIDDYIGSVVELWADTTEPRVAAATEIQTAASFTGAVITDCFTAQDQLLAFGAFCSDDAVRNGAYLSDKCDGRIWTSETGRTWIEHPLTKLLTQANASFISGRTHLGQGVVARLELKDGGSQSLWLVTPDDLMEIPTDGVSSQDKFTFEDIAISQGSVMLRSGSLLFTGTVDNLLRRTLGDDRAQEWLHDAQDTPRTQLSISALSNQPPDASATPAARATPTPAAPTAQPTSLPQPTSTPPPAVARQVPTCNPGDLTTSGACTCSGGRLFDNGGQCIMRCRSGETADGFGGCIRSDGNAVDPGPGISVEFSVEVPVDETTADN